MVLVLVSNVVLRRSLPQCVLTNGRDELVFMVRSRPDSSETFANE